MEQPFFEIPAMLFVLCFFVSVALLFSPFIWLWHIRQAGGDGGDSLVAVCSKSLVRALFSVMVFSLIYGALKGEVLGVRFAEVFMLAAISGGFLFRCLRGGGVSFRRVSLMALKALGGCLGYALSGFALVGAFFLLLKLWVMASALLGIPLALEVYIFILGGLYFGVLYLYFRGVKESLDSAVVGEIRFYDALWPIVIGLVILIFPLWLMQVATDEEMYDLYHAQPSPPVAFHGNENNIGGNVKMPS